MLLLAALLLAVGATDPTADAACAALAARVAAGTAPLGELVSRCTRQDVARAVLATTGSPDVTGFATAPARNQGVETKPDASSSTRLAWAGTCLARIEEALPAPTLGPQAACLGAMTLREDASTERPEDQRADWLMKDARLLERWHACARHAGAERCLDRLLPLSGGGPPRDLDTARWVADRDQPSPADVPAARDARCRLAVVDRDAGLLAFRCEGTLVEETCQSVWSLSFDSAYLGDQMTCGEDKRALVVIAEVGPAPPGACVTAARAALGASRTQFPAARAAAFAACAPASAAAPGSEPTDPFEDDELTPAVRALIHRVLERQEMLFGSFRLPSRCRRAGGACRVAEDDGLARRAAQGCGVNVWLVQPDGGQGFSDGSWSQEDDRSLIRLPATARPRQRFGSVTTFGTAHRSGNYFGSLQGGTKIYDESDVIQESCIAHQADDSVCRAYAVGGRETDMFGRRSAAEWARVEQLVDADWPRASRRLARWQAELARGQRLDPINGEGENWSCAPLLIDACTGDIGEVCTGLSRDQPRCEGRRLPDGRCRRHHFARLPLAPATPARSP